MPKFICPPYPLHINKRTKTMSTKKSGFKSATIITAAIVTFIALAAACGGPKTAAPKPDDEPSLRDNKAKMMNKMDTTMNRR